MKFKFYECSFERLILIFSGIPHPTKEMEEQVFAIVEEWA